MAPFTITPRGPFSIAAAREFFGGLMPASGTWRDAGGGLVMTFPVDGWRSSAAVRIRERDGSVEGEIVAWDGEVEVEVVRAQVARTLSLDHDGSGFAEVGRRDATVGRLQAEVPGFRPVCFYSPYEAAAWALIGHRIQMRQAARIKGRIAEQLGARLTIDGQTLYAFPRPERLLELTDARGMTLEKLRRLHILAEATLDGRLDADHLRSLPVDKALADLRRLPGIGEWSSQHVLLRGAGLVDEVPSADPRLRDAVRLLYELSTEPSDEALRELAQPWRPYRMWVCVLLRAWFTRNVGPAGSRG